MLCGWEGNRRSGVALAMRHRLSGLSTYRLNGHQMGRCAFVGYGHLPLPYHILLRSVDVHIGTCPLLLAKATIFINLVTFTIFEFHVEIVKTCLRCIWSSIVLSDYELHHRVADIRGWEP